MIDKYYVYELWNPLNNQIFYVGLGTGIRAEKHFRYLNDSDKSLKSNIIRKILASNQKPIIKKVFFTNNRNNAQEKEIELISYYGRRINGGILSNITSGGDGGDTVTGQDPSLIKIRYEKRKNSLNLRSEEEIKKSKDKKSKSVREAWGKNKDIWTNKIRHGINHNRNKESHANSVSKGWKNRSKEEKKLTSQKRTNINLKNWQDPEMIKKFQKSVDKIGISVKITNNNGEIFYSRSLLSWCKKNKQSYCVLWDILKGKGPKPNKYKQSKYLNWKVEKHE